MMTFFVSMLLGLIFGVLFGALLGFMGTIDFFEKEFERWNYDKNIENAPGQAERQLDTDES